MGRANPPGFVMGSAGVWVRVDILLPGPNPYPVTGFMGTGRSGARKVTHIYYLLPWCFVTVPALV